MLWIISFCLVPCFNLLFFFFGDTRHVMKANFRILDDLLHEVGQVFRYFFNDLFFKSHRIVFDFQCPCFTWIYEDIYIEIRLFKSVFYINGKP